MRVETSLPIKMIFISILFFGMINLAIAQENRKPQKGTPPQEAITACTNQYIGSICSMKTPRGDMLEGTCKYTPDNKYFVCMPEGGSQMPPQRQ